MQNDSQIIVSQLSNLFAYMFEKQQLRRNVYLFNAINQHMILSVRTIQKEKRVVGITKDVSLILAALKNCASVQVLSDTNIRLLMRGDQTIVRLRNEDGKSISKKEINNLTRQMRCESKQEKNEWVLQFQSRAAAVQFIERAKTHQKTYIFELLENDPYECFAKSIANIRKQKKAEKTVYSPQEVYNMNYCQQYLASLFPQYAPFIRKAVESDDEEPVQQNMNRTQEQAKNEQKKQMGSRDFPSFEDVRQVIGQAK